MLALLAAALLALPARANADMAAPQPGSPPGDTVAAPGPSGRPRCAPRRPSLLPTRRSPPPAAAPSSPGAANSGGNARGALPTARSRGIAARRARGAAARHHSWAELATAVAADADPRVRQPGLLPQHQEQLPHRIVHARQLRIHRGRYQLHPAPDRRPADRDPVLRPATGQGRRFSCADGLVLPRLSLCRLARDSARAAPRSRLAFTTRSTTSTRPASRSCCRRRSIRSSTATCCSRRPGELYGYLHLGPGGGLEYRFYGGTLFADTPRCRRARS